MNCVAFRPNFSIIAKSLEFKKNEVIVCNNLILSCVKMNGNKIEMSDNFHYKKKYNIISKINYTGID